MPEENKVRDAADAIKGVVEAVPIYQDLAQPAIREVGQNLATVTKTLRLVLAPISGLVWGYEKIEDFVKTEVAKRLEKVPPERIATPAANVAGPALEALRYTGHDEDLRAMYANLLATSIDAATATTAHPGFVEIIRQLTPDEAKLLRWIATNTDRPRALIDISQGPKEGNGAIEVRRSFSLLGEDAGCTHCQMVPSYLANLCRLGVCQIPAMVSYTDKGVYKSLREHPQVISLEKQIEARGFISVVSERVLEVTPYGSQFLRACVLDHSA